MTHRHFFYYTTDWRECLFDVQSSSIIYSAPMCSSYNLKQNCISGCLEKIFYLPGHSHSGFFPSMAFHWARGHFSIKKLFLKTEKITLKNNVLQKAWSTFLTNLRLFKPILSKAAQLFSFIFVTIARHKNRRAPIRTCWRRLLYVKGKSETKDREEKKALHPTGFKPVAFQFSGWQADALTVPGRAKPLPI